MILPDIEGPMPLMLSTMSPVENPAFAAGEFGTAPTTPT